jgi:hypothetical protein
MADALVRTNGIAPTKQAEIEAAYAALDAREIGDFNADYMQGQIRAYLRNAGPFCSDEDFLAAFGRNLRDSNAVEKPVRALMQQRRLAHG